MKLHGSRLLGLLARIVMAMTISFIAAPVQAQSATTLASRIEAAMGTLQANSIPGLNEVMQDVVSAAKVARERITAVSGPDNATAWFAYLKTESVTDAIEAVGDFDEKPKTRDEAKKKAATLKELSDELNNFLARTTLNYPGLELAGIPDLRAAARRLDAMFRHRDAERSIKYIQQQMELVVESLRDSEGSIGPKEYFELESLVRLLAETNQASGLVADIRSQFGQPNLRVNVGCELVCNIASRPFNEPAKVNECMFGTRIVGDATLTGTVTARLVPSFGTARIQLILQGNLSSQNRGYQYPVSVDARGYGTVTATKYLSLNDSGLRSKPAIAQAQIGSQIQRVNHPLKIVRRIAMKKAREQSGRSNAEGARRLEKRVAKSFDKQTDESSPLGAGDSSPLKDMLAILNRMGLDEPTRDWSSVTRYMMTTVRQQSDDSLASAIGPPPISGSHQLAIQVHESMVNNVATRIFGGRTLTGPQMQKLAKSFFPEAEFKKQESSQNSADEDDEASENEVDEEEPAEVTFSRARPIIFEARDGKLIVGIRGTRFKQGENDLREQLVVRATYEPIMVVGVGYQLERTGDVEIDFPGSSRRTILQIATRKKMELVFGRALPKRLLEEPIKIPVKQLPESGVRVREFSAGQGWLTLGLR